MGVSTPFLFALARNPGCLLKCPGLWEISGTTTSPAITIPRIQLGCAMDTSGIICKRRTVMRCRRRGRGCGTGQTWVPIPACGSAVRPGGQASSELLFSPLEKALPRGIATRSRVWKLPVQSLVHSGLLKTRAGGIILVRRTSIKYPVTFLSWTMALPASDPPMGCQGTKL